MREPVLAIAGLRTGYGGEPVLDGIELTLGAGEIVAVVGRNGVGKSTLMRALIGLLPLSSGAIRLNGHDVTGTEAHQRARLGIGYVPQGRDVFPRLTVAENLAVGQAAGRRGDSDGNALVFHYFPILAERRRQRAGTLSGGQQQQLALARALIARPRVLLLDEPSEGIQPNVVAAIGQSVVALSRETGLTVLLVEQNHDLIRGTAGRGHVLDKGRLVATLDAATLHDRTAMRRHLAV